jgi:poly-gamma-glutamate synthesis protein (capsule biosynthesis protein)
MQDEPELTMVIVGDVMLERKDPPSIFRHVGDQLRNADFTLGNLEGVCADAAGERWSKGGSYRLKSGGGLSGGDGIEPSNAKFEARQLMALEAAGFDALTLANNHTLDFGHAPLVENLQHLDRMGIAHTGAGRTFAEAHAPAIVERKGCRVALLGYTSVFMRGWEADDKSPGVAAMRVRTTYEPTARALELPGLPPKIHTWVLPEDKIQLETAIHDARDRADIVICTFHWGLSGQDVRLPDYQTELAHHAIDAGADLVFGHHPHMLQGIEVYRGRAIFYCLGPFGYAHFDPKKGYELEAMMVRCHIRKHRLQIVEYLPVCSDEQLDPHILGLVDGRKVIDLIAKRSAAFGTRFSAKADAMQVVLADPC